jgi:outer membrane autotransporter protein
MAAIVTAPSLAADDEWDAATGYWSEGANWLSGAVPEPGENVTITDGIARIDGTSQAASRVNVGAGILRVSNGGSLDAGPTVLNCGDCANPAESSLIVSGGSLSTGTDPLTVGTDGVAVAIIERDGAVTSGGDSRIGHDTSADGGGAARVSIATGSSWTIDGDLIMGASSGPGPQETGVAVGGRTRLQAERVVTEAGTHLIFIGMDRAGENVGVLDVDEVVGGEGDTTLRVNQSTDDYHLTDTGTAAGTPVRVSGGTEVVVDGSGRTVLAGVNTHDGGTTVSANSTLAISADENLGAAAGGLVLEGSTLETHGSFTTARTTTLTPQSLRLGGTVVIQAGETLTHEGRITGTGALTKSGTGSLLLTGDSDYTGATIIEAGRLTVNGSVTDSAIVRVTDGAVLSGGGALGDVRVEGSGRVTPGNSIGTLDVGAFTFGADATYTVEADAAGNSDRIEATGPVDIAGGTVDVNAENGDYRPSTDYTIVRTSDPEGISGTFDTVTTNLAFLDPSLGYDADRVTLRLTRNDVSYETVAYTPNQNAVSDALAVAETNGELPAIVTDLSARSARGAREAYDNLSGVQHTHAQLASLEQQRRFRGLLFDRLAGGAHANAMSDGESLRVAFSGEDWARMLAAGSATTAAAGTAAKAGGRGLWVRALGGTGDIDATSNASGSDYTNATVALGADTRLGNGLVVGLAGSYGRTDSDTAANGGLDTDSYQLAGYGGWRDGGAYIDASIGFGEHRTDAERNVSVGGTTRTAIADYETRQYSASVEGGRTWAWTGGATFTPFAGLDMSEITREGFTERGAGPANLDVDERTETSVRTRLGLRLATAFETAGGTELQPRFEMAWVREHRDRNAALTARFEPAPATTFTVEGPELDRDRAAVGVGVTATVDEASRLDIEYRGDIADSDQHHGIAVTWRTRW